MPSNYRRLTAGDDEYTSFDGNVQRVKLTTGAPGTQTDLGPESQLPMTATSFDVACGTITRSSTTTAYALGQIIQGSGISVLPEIDLSAITGAAARNILIHTVIINSSNAAASVKLSAQIHFCNVNNPQTVTDYTAVALSAADAGTKVSATAEGVSAQVSYGSSIKYMQTDILRQAKTSASGKLFAMIVANSLYTPANGETLTVRIKGYLL